MRILLSIIGIIVFLYSACFMGEATNMDRSILFLISAVLISGAAIIDAIVRAMNITRQEIKEIIWWQDHSGRKIEAMNITLKKIEEILKIQR